jgi:dienelactone hydrolase
MNENVRTCPLTCALSIFTMLGLSCADASDLSGIIQKEFAARDSLEIGIEPSADARNCLDGLKWREANFQVRCEGATRGLGDVLVRFPSAVESGDKKNDIVAMEWYVARSQSLEAIKAPAVVVVHESGSGMVVGRLIANGLRQHGLHAFLIHLPFYGERRTVDRRPAAENMISTIRQAVADVRRARDAAAALPLVDSSHIALQGTSLGGFVSATTAALDSGYDSVYLVLAGGDIFDVIQNGKKDAAKVRDRLAKAGLTSEKLRALTSMIEPTRIAHRLDPIRTWLYSAKHDTVVPMKNALLLARAARLGKGHHIHLDANHYSGIIYLPIVLNHMTKQIRRMQAAD